MKHSFTSNHGHSLEVRESGRSTKLFLTIDGKSKRIDDQPLKPAIVTALLQEITRLKLELDSSYKANPLNDETLSVIIQKNWT